MKIKKISCLVKKASSAIVLAALLAACSSSYDSVWRDTEEYAREWAQQDKDLNKELVGIPFIYNNDVIVKSWRDMAILSQKNIRNYGSLKQYEIFDRFLVVGNTSEVIERPNVTMPNKSTPSFFRSVIAKDIHALHMINNKINLVAVYVLDDSLANNRVAIIIDSDSKKIIGVTKYQF